MLVFVFSERYLDRMPSTPTPTSIAVARLLRERRQALGLTLRQVETLSGERGKAIPHSTLARIESAEFDPGVKRLQQLLRLYGIRTQVAGDLLDLEDLTAPVPFERDPTKLRAMAVTHWRAGKIPEALAAFIAFRQATSNPDVSREMRHKAIIDFAIAASSLGQHHLARQLLDDVLVDAPAPDLLVSILVQLSVVWRSLGSIEAALAFLERAATHVPKESHRQIGWLRHQRALIQIDAREFGAAGKSLRAAERSYQQAKSDHDCAIVMVSFAHLAFKEGQAVAAVRAADRAAAFATEHGFGRIRLAALIERSRALQLGDRVEESRDVLRRVLADSIAADDNVIRFYAHYYSWKAELMGGSSGRAEIELREAGYYLSFVDQTSPEAADVRAHAPPRS